MTCLPLEITSERRVNRIVQCPKDARISRHPCMLPFLSLAGFGASLHPFHLQCVTEIIQSTSSSLLSRGNTREIGAKGAQQEEDVTRFVAGRLDVEGNFPESNARDNSFASGNANSVADFRNGCRPCQLHNSLEL